MQFLKIINEFLKLFVKKSETWTTLMRTEKFSAWDRAANINPPQDSPWKEQRRGGRVYLTVLDTPVCKQERTAATGTWRSSLDKQEQDQHWKAEQRACEGREQDPEYADQDTHK